MQVAVSARSQHVRALVCIRNGGPVARRVAGERSDHRERHRDQPRKLTLHARIVAHERQWTVKISSVLVELAKELVGNASEDDARLEEEQSLDVEGALIVEDAAPAVKHDSGRTTFTATSGSAVSSRR